MLSSVVLALDFPLHTATGVPEAVPPLTGSATPNLEHTHTAGGEMDETGGNATDSGCILTP